ncbi:MAG: flagellar motor switch protein FliG [Spirochaetales bacterium]|jgi:flagellar motor switch protein FliG|nr:flagellar motor switch protein FliG [Spirochaetales bacterium]
MSKRKGLEAYQRAAASKPPQPSGTPGAVPDQKKAASPEDLRGFIKEGSSSDSPGGAGSAVSGSGYRKAAGLLLLVGQDQAARILKDFSPPEIEKIVREIALINKLTPEEARGILSEFQEARLAGTPVAGGVEAARQMLVGAFGEEKGQELYKKFLPFDGATPFAFLDDLEYNQIETLLKNESPQVLSLILSYLDPKKASLIVENMEAPVRLSVVRRLARKAEVKPEVISIIENCLREKIRDMGSALPREIDGESALAGILRYMDPGEEEKILDALAQEVDPGVSESIREKIFTIQDILRIPDPEFQAALRDYDDRELAVIIKGKADRIRQKFLTNLSERRAWAVNEESAHLGAMLKRDVDSATREFLTYLRDLDEGGKIHIPRSENEWV